MLEEKKTQLLSKPTLFDVGGEEHMLVIDHPLLSYSIMLTVTRIEFVTLHSLV